ncbi:Pycsar system effector family protein [Streptomyces sp. NPDC053048]|uniref:Pycsar system effector family protein n=1 Tax=Streptomyces sp. NPDC053048 TaxID=3365694 RepID=UPI0037D6DA65
MLSAFSLPLAALVASVPGNPLPTTPAVLVGIGAIGLVTAMLVVLLVIRPRLGAGARGNFLHWANCTPETLMADLQNPGDRAADVIRLSQIARRKYLGLRIAGDITGAALIALAAALLTALS